MKFRKAYGQSKDNLCAFCGRNAFSKNSQGVPTCSDHKTQTYDLNCICGLSVDIREGKYGPYALCQKCGIQKISRLLEMQPDPDQNYKIQGAKPQAAPKPAPAAVPAKKPVKSIHDMDDDDALFACFH